MRLEVAPVHVLFELLPLGLFLPLEVLDPLLEVALDHRLAVNNPTLFFLEFILGVNEYFLFLIRLRLICSVLMNSRLRSIHSLLRL